MNIFENAKFGDRFRTRDGKMAILVDCEIKLNTNSEKPYNLFVYGDVEITKYDNQGKLYGECYAILDDGSIEEYDDDIVGRWTEPIDE